MIRENFRQNLIMMLEKQGRGARAKLAAFLDTSPAFVSQLCSGACVPTVERIEQIAEFFGVSDLKMVSGTRSKLKAEKQSRWRVVDAKAG